MSNNIDYQNTNFKLNTEAHDETNSHLNNIHSCLSECDYYTDSELNAMHVNKQSTSCISTLSINCRIISKKFDNIESSLKSLDNKCDFVGLSETWLKTNDNSDIFNLPDYTLLSRPRADKRGGGVGFYVTDKTSFKVRDDIVMNPVKCQYESLVIETVMHDHKVSICVIYKPPESNTDIFVAHFSDLMGIFQKNENSAFKKKTLYLTSNRQMYNASQYHKITAIYTHAHTWTHVHRHSS